MKLLQMKAGQFWLYQMRLVVICLQSGLAAAPGATAQRGKSAVTGYAFLRSGLSGFPPMYQTRFWHEFSAHHSVCSLFWNTCEELSCCTETEDSTQGDAYTKVVCWTVDWTLYLGGEVLMTAGQQAVCICNYHECSVEYNVHLGHFHNHYKQGYLALRPSVTSSMMHDICLYRIDVIHEQFASLAIQHL